MASIARVDFANFNMTSFKDREDEAKNLLETGNLNYFFEKFNEIEQTAEKTALLFENLSLIMSMQGPYKWKCESSLKGQIYSISSIYPSDVKTIIGLPEYKFNPYLSEVISKVRYLAKNRLVSNSDNWFLYETRFSHHLEKILGNLHTMSKGAAYLAGGAAFFITGVNKFYPDDPTKGPNQQVGGPAIFTGIALMASPFISAFQSSGTDNP